MRKRAIHPGIVALLAVVLAATLAGLYAGQPKPRLFDLVLF